MGWAGALAGAVQDHLIFHHARGMGCAGALAGAGSNPGLPRCGVGGVDDAPFAALPYAQTAGW